MCRESGFILQLEDEVQDKAVTAVGLFKPVSCTAVSGLVQTNLILRLSSSSRAVLYAFSARLRPA